MEPTEALTIIVNNYQNTALNYAVNYAKYALGLTPGTKEYKVQLLYVATNLSSWRYNKNFTISKETIKEVRNTIKKGAGIKV